MASSLLMADDVTPPWMAAADCRGATDLFYLGDDNPAPALEVCRSCPVRQPCLDFALATNEEHGIWGGMTARARKQHLRRLRKARYVRNHQARLEAR